MSAHREYSVNENVPIEDRHMSFSDMIFTWMGGNCQPGSWTMGGTLAAVGFTGALGITLLANPLAYFVLALIGYMAYKVGTTTMGLTRVSLGIKGSYIATVANIINLYGWTAVTNFLAAITMSYIAKSLFGTPAFMEPGSAPIMAAGAALNGLLSFAAISIGGARSLKVFEKIMMGLLIILTIWISIILMKTISWAQLMSWEPPVDVKVPFGIGLDAMLAFSLVWATLIGDFTRYTGKAKNATLAPALGANIAVYWFVSIGIIGVIAHAANTGIFNGNMANPSTLSIELGLGWVAMIIVIFSTVTTNMIDLYGSAVNVMNLFPKVKFKTAALISGIVTICVSWVPLFVGNFLTAFFGFMNILGAVFPPLLAILIVDYYLIRKGNYKISEIDKADGIYWYKAGFNIYSILSWFAGIVLFIVLRNAGLGATSFGSVIPSLLLTGAIYYGLATIASKKGDYPDTEE